MDQLHRHLLEHNSTYRRWHEHSSHRLAHFLIFMIVAVMTTGTLLSKINQIDAATPSVLHRPFAALNFKARMNGKSELRGEAAIAALGNDANIVGQYYRLSGEGLKKGLRNDPTLHINSEALLFHADTLLPQGATPGDGSIVNNPTPDQIPDSLTFRLHSRPSATARIYLNFTGATTTYPYWNNGATIVSAPYSLDADPAISSAEMLQIRKMWTAVAEDYAPFNVDVTTEFTATPPDRYKYSQIIISPTTWRSGVGGIAYVGSFTWGDDPRAFVFSAALSNGSKYIAEAISHESGHTLGLGHTSKYDTACTMLDTYYVGSKGTDNPGWAPIMGNSYYYGVTSWVNSSEVDNVATPYGCTSEQDQVSMITSQNGFGFATDEAGATASTATVLPAVSSSATAAVDTIGVLTQNDVDMYKFTTTGGDMTFAIKPVQLATTAMLGNADFAVRLLDNNLVPISQSNPIAVGTATVLKTAAPAGTYYLEIAATGYQGFAALGGYTVSSSMGKYQIVGTYGGTTTPTDTTAPSATLTAPANGATLSGTVALTATASDAVGVDHVDFYRNGTVIGADATAPYSMAWDTTQSSNTTYTIGAIAYDAAGNAGTSNTVSVTVNNVVTPPADTTPPTVAVTAPAAGASVSGTTTLAATATDNIGISYVGFYRGSTLVSTDTTAPYAVSWDTTAVSNASYSITAKAYDAAGNTTTSAPVSVTVANTIAADTTAPTATISSPTSGTTLRGTKVNIKTGATDAGKVARMEILIDNAVVTTGTSSATSATLSYSWSFKSVAAGAHTITVQAYDAAGNMGSKSVTVTK